VGNGVKWRGRIGTSQRREMQGKMAADQMIRRRRKRRKKRKKVEKEE
jgi:hypothetical protein